MKPARSRGRFACNLEKAGVPPSQLVSTSFKAVAGAFIERWNSRIRGTIRYGNGNPTGELRFPDHIFSIESADEIEALSRR
jgi:hypothetical protein